MRSIPRFPSALALALLWSTAVWAAPAKSKAGAKKSAKEVSSDDSSLQKQMDWENKLMGPNTEKKIDLAKIQKLQAEEAARREKQDKLDKLDKDKKEREAAAAAQRKDVRAPSTRDVPEIEETPPPPPKPAEKHDDAFVDKLLKDKGGPKKKVTVSNDEVDQLLAKAKSDKPAPAAGKGKGKGADGVDQLLATADKQPTIKTTVRKNESTSEPVSAEAAAREVALKAIAAAAAAKADDERTRNKRPVIPDAAVLRARSEQNARAQQASSSSSSASSRPTAPARAGWTDPFASDAPAPTKRAKGRVDTTVAPPDDNPSPVSGRHTPVARPAARERDGGWKDPFDSGSAPRAKPAAPAKAAPAKPPKHPANWKDPFA